jgi:hypothetical protein
MIFLTDISRDCQFHYGVIGLEYLLDPISMLISLRVE